MNLSRTGEATLLLVATLTIMVGATVAPGLQSIAPALGVAAYAPLLITLPALGAIIFAPLAGKLIDNIGARPTLILCLAGYFLAGTGAIFLHGPWPVAADRIILGGFAAGSMAAGTALISQWYVGNARLKMIAKQGMAIELGGVFVLFLGGILAEFNWRGPFALYAVALLSLLLLLCFVPATAPAPQHSDESAPTATPSMRPVVIFATTSMALFFSMFILLPGVMAQVGYSESQTGYLLSFISLVAVFAAMLMPKVVATSNANSTLMLAFASYAVALIGFGLTATPLGLAIAAIFAGVGFGFSIPLLNHAAVERSTDHTRGRNLAWFAMAVFLGQFATSALEFVPLSPQLTLMCCAAMAAICALWVRRATL